MEGLDAALMVRALREVGEELRRGGVATGIDVVLAGGAAGLLGGWLRASRTTTDCDVVWTGDEPTWAVVQAAARRVAGELDLKDGWLNRDVTHFQWSWPLGWQRRCEAAGTFGGLRIRRLARTDLIAAKVISAPRRPQDLSDLRDMRPTRDELATVLENLARLEAEDLDGTSYRAQREIVAVLMEATS